MADKKVYAWAYLKPADRYNPRILMVEKDKRTGLILKDGAKYHALYSIEEVQHVIENNELPKRPVAWIRWNDGDEHKRAYPDAITGGMRWENTVIVCTADELLAELQKET